MPSIKNVKDYEEYIQELRDFTVRPRDITFHFEKDGLFHDVFALTHGSEHWTVMDFTKDYRRKAGQLGGFVVRARLFKPNYVSKKKGFDPERWIETTKWFPNDAYDNSTHGNFYDFVEKVSSEMVSKEREQFISTNV